MEDERSFESFRTTPTLTHSHLQRHRKSEEYSLSAKSLLYPFPFLHRATYAIAVLPPTHAPLYPSIHPSSIPHPIPIPIHTYPLHSTHNLYPCSGTLVSSSSPCRFYVCVDTPHHNQHSTAPAPAPAPSLYLCTHYIHTYTPSYLRGTTQRVLTHSL